MKRILLISFFNSSNIGDRAICRTLEEKLAQIAIVKKLDITGKELWDTQLCSGDTGEHRPKKKSRLFQLKSIVALRWPGRFDYAKACIEMCDAVVFAGGNMIMDLERFSLYSFLMQKYIHHARKHKKRTAIVFVGVGKIRTRLQKRRWHKVLQRSSLLSVRDAGSRERMLQDLHITNDIQVWRDPVFWLENKKTQHGHKRVAINVFLGAVKIGEQRERLKATYLHLISALRNEYGVILYSTEKNDDGGLYEVYHSLGSSDRVSVCSPNSVEELMDLYGDVDSVIATRMHAFIVATTQETPALVLAWDPKVNGVAAGLGLSDRVIDINVAYEKRDEILERIKVFAQEPEKHAEEIRRINKQTKAELDTSLALIRAFLEETK